MQSQLAHPPAPARVPRARHARADTRGAQRSTFVFRRAAFIALPWLIVIGIWYAIAYSGLINPSLVPTPHRVAWRFWELLTTARLPLDILMSTDRKSVV